MNPILDVAKAHLGGASLDFIDVPEWSEVEPPLRIWFRTRMTIRERDKLYNKPDGGSYTGFVTMARCVAFMALDEKGARMFNELDDLHALTYQVDQSVVGRIASKILVTTGQVVAATEQVEDQKKA